MIAADSSVATLQSSPARFPGIVGCRLQAGGFEILLAALAGRGGSCSRTQALVTLEQAVEATGRAVEDLELGPEAEQALKELLVEAGYSLKQAKAIIREARGSDGGIDLKKLIELLRGSVAELGPVVVLPVEAKAELVQVLKDLGLADEKVREFIEGCESDGRFIKIRGLAQLLAQVPQQFKKVDETVLRDLLLKLGLSEDEVQFLVAQGADAQGRLEPMGFVRVLQAAVAMRSRPMLKALKELVANLRLKAQPAAVSPRQMAELKSQLLKSLEALEALGTTGEGIGAEGGRIVGELQALVQDGRPAELARTMMAELAEVHSREGFKPTLGHRRVRQPVRTQVFAQLHSALKAATARAEIAQGVVPPQVVRQVAARVAQMVRTAQPSLRFTLVPPVLGELEVEVGMEGGGLKVRLVAETEAARQMLHSGAEHLRQHLAAQGIKVEKVEIMLNPDAQPQTREHQTPGGRKGQGGGGRAEPGVGVAVDDQQEEELARVVEGQLISLFA